MKSAPYAPTQCVVLETQQVLITGLTVPWSPMAHRIYKGHTGSSKDGAADRNDLASRLNGETVDVPNASKH